MTSAANAPRTARRKRRVLNSTLLAAKTAGRGGGPWLRPPMRKQVGNGGHRRADRSLDRGERDVHMDPGHLLIHRPRQEAAALRGAGPELLIAVVVEVGDLPLHHF